jgi:diaminopimelate decarboxylase
VRDGDTFTMNREMDRWKRGDLIVFRTAGAYGAALSNGYNSRPLARKCWSTATSGQWCGARVDPEALAAVDACRWR